MTKRFIEVLSKWLEKLRGESAVIIAHQTLFRAGPPRGSRFGVRRREPPSAAAAPGTPPVGALVAGDLSPAASRQVATDHSGDRSPHSKKSNRQRVNKTFTLRLLSPERPHEALNPSPGDLS